MEFQHRYFGETGATSDASASNFSFAPDTLREPTFFVGEVAEHLPFREAISALHHVVVSDMRFKPKDRTAYFNWLKEHEQQLLAEALTQQTSIKSRLDVLRNEINDIYKRMNKIMAPFYGARKKYFDWLYKESRDAWIVLDPVITVHPDEIFFECFSQDESSYGRLCCDHDAFEHMGDLCCGTTNVYYTAPFTTSSRRSAATRRLGSPWTRRASTCRPRARNCTARKRSTCPIAGCGAFCKCRALWRCGRMSSSCIRWTCTEFSSGSPCARNSMGRVRCASCWSREAGEGADRAVEQSAGIPPLHLPGRGGRGNPPLGPAEAAVLERGCRWPGRFGSICWAPACLPSTSWMGACASRSACRAGPQTTGRGRGNSTCWRRASRWTRRRPGACSRR